MGIGKKPLTGNPILPISDDLTGSSTGMGIGAKHEDCRMHGCCREDFSRGIAPSQNRTGDLRIMRPTLYQRSSRSDCPHAVATSQHEYIDTSITILTCHTIPD